MNLLFWKKCSQRGLSPILRMTLRRQYNLDDPTLDRLCCISQSGRYTNRPVRLVRIFDPTLVRKGKIRRYDDIMAQRHALMFEGHIERDGNAYLLDKRTQKAAERVAAKT